MADIKHRLCVCVSPLSSQRTYAHGYALAYVRVVMWCDESGQCSLADEEDNEL